MIKYVKQDITTVERGVIAHGVNCKGVMGSGIALAIKNKWPEAFFDYKELCDETEHPASLLGITQSVQINDELYVLNNFTQESFGQYGQKYDTPHASLEAVEETLEHTFAYAEYVNLPLYIPKIGCLRGGLDWEQQVCPIVFRLTKEYPSVNTTVVDI